MLPKRLTLTLASLLWLAGSLAGLGFLLHYQASPGLAGTAPPEWPAKSAIRREPGKFTLLMFVHPQCPCTRATIGELALLMARCRNQVNAYVLFMTPEGAREDWTKTDLWRSAGAIPGVQTIRDEHGVEAACFQAQTSGHTLLYSPEGTLQFSGGITAGRGHSGDNSGRSFIVSHIHQGSPEQSRTAVYGCPLKDSPEADACPN